MATLPLNPALRTEEYIFLRLSEHDMEQAQETFILLRDNTKNNYFFPLIRDIVISYTRPFSGNRGIQKPKYKLPKKELVPKKFYPLHDSLIKFRDTMFAHTDIKAKEAKLGRWNRAGQIIYPMSFKMTRYDDLRGDIENINDLIGAVKLNVIRKFRKIEQEENEKHTEKNISLKG
jgi:hypothetical protein